MIMTHLVAGYPTMNESERLAIAMAQADVSFIEIQIPFSDPIADGKTIASANQDALKNGVTPDDCFELMERLKKQIKIPFLFMTYYNIPFIYGLERFCKKARNVGCFGLIIPDIPVDEEKHDHYLALCRKYGLHAIQIISPLTPPRRLRKINRVASGFVYCVSHLGTTGEKKSFDSSLKSYVSNVRRYITKTPLALGFGISTRQQIKRAQTMADIVVVGSKIINLYNESKDCEKIEGVKKFLQRLKSDYRRI